MPTIPGTVVAAKVTTGNTANTFAVADQGEIRGGFHSVATLGERDAITDGRREEGMVCWVVAETMAYQLRGGVTNESWVEFQLGGGTGSGVPTFSYTTLTKEGTYGGGDTTYVVGQETDYQTLKVQVGSVVLPIRLGPATGAVQGSTVVRILADGDSTDGSYTGKTYVRVVNYGELSWQGGVPVSSGEEGLIEIPKGSVGIFSYTIMELEGEGGFTVAVAVYSDEVGGSLSVPEWQRPLVQVDTVTTVPIDLSGDRCVYVLLEAASEFTVSGQAGAKVVQVMVVSTGEYQVTFPSRWAWVSEVPSTISRGGGVLSLTTFGEGENRVVAEWRAQVGGEFLVDVLPPVGYPYFWPVVPPAHAFLFERFYGGRSTVEALGETFESTEQTLDEVSGRYMEVYNTTLELGQSLQVVEGRFGGGLGYIRRGILEGSHGFGKFELTAPGVSNQSPWTVMFWIKPSAASQADSASLFTLSSNEDPAASGASVVNLVLGPNGEGGSTLTLVESDPLGVRVAHVADQGVNISDGEWHRVVCGYDGSGLWTRVDGGSAQRGQIRLGSGGGRVDTYIPDGATLVALLVGYFEQGSNRAEFVMDNLLFWDRNLTELELAWEWNGGAGRSYPENPPSFGVEDVMPSWVRVTGSYRMVNALDEGSTLQEGVEGLSYAGLAEDRRTTWFSYRLKKVAGDLLSYVSDYSGGLDQEETLVELILGQDPTVKLMISGGQVLFTVWDSVQLGYVPLVSNNGALGVGEVVTPDAPVIQGQVEEMASLVLDEEATGRFVTSGGQVLLVLWDDVLQGYVPLVCANGVLGVGDVVEPDVLVVEDAVTSMATLILAQSPTSKLMVSGGEVLLAVWDSFQRGYVPLVCANGILGVGILVNNGLVGIEIRGQAGTTHTMGIETWYLEGVENVRVLVETESRGTALGTYIAQASSSVQRGTFLVEPDSVCFATGATLLEGSEGEAYSLALTIVHAETGSQSYSIVSGRLPIGLELNQATGEIFGTPTFAETQEFTLKVSETVEGEVSESTKTFSLTVNAVPLEVELVGPG